VASDPATEAVFRARGRRLPSAPHAERELRVVADFFRRETAARRLHSSARARVPVRPEV
jgi:hypothetical protein